MNLAAIVQVLEHLNHFEIIGYGSYFIFYNLDPIKFVTYLDHCLDKKISKTWGRILRYFSSNIF